ncbi:MAG: methyltransferase domain-containing protein [Proteobacteria bacterium]|nr:methyltransferase domain-containing protein [Pseudomonadota bacterium]
MLTTTLIAPRARLASYMALTEVYADLSLDASEAKDGPDFYLYTFFLPETLQDALTHALAPHELTFTAVPENVDYVALTRANFPPLAIGPFFITRNGEKAPPGTMAIAIAPNRAFGSGEHATTSGCLKAYLQAAQSGSFHTGLDLGAGSGILAICAARHRQIRFTCVEIDEPSVTICTQNATLNHVSTLVTSILGSTPPAGQIFDLVFANILLTPLLELAPQLAKALAPKGTLILSGFTQNQGPQIEAAYTAQNLKLTNTLQQAEWLTHTYTR